MYLTLIGLVLAGCRGSAPTVDPSSVDNLGLTRDDYYAGVEAREKLVAGCMEKSGFDYEPAPAEGQIVFTEDQRYYGISEGLTNQTRNEPPSDNPNLEGLEGESGASYQAAFEQCAQRADAETADEVAKANDFRDVLNEALADFQQSDVYQKALGEWSACMDGLGFDFTKPEDAEGAVQEQARSLIEHHGGDIESIAEQEVAELEAFERSVFQADQKCQATTLAPIMADFKKHLLSERSDEVARLRDVVRKGG